MTPHSLERWPIAGRTSFRGVDLAQVTVVTLKVTCQTKGDFSTKFLNEFPNGGFFVPTRLRAKVGEPVMLSLRIGSRSAPVLLRAFVRWIQRGKVSPKLRAGVAVEFLPSEARRRDHLLALANADGSTSSTRRHLRIPMDHPIRWTVRGAAQDRPGLLHDIGVGGARIYTKEWVAERSETFVTIFPPGAAAAMSIQARVAWPEPGVGFGVAWRARDRGGARRIKELVRRLEQLTRAHESHFATWDVHSGPAVVHSPPPPSPAPSARLARKDENGSGSSQVAKATVVERASGEWQEFNQERSYQIRDYRHGNLGDDEPPALRAAAGASGLFEVRGVGSDVSPEGGRLRAASSGRQGT